MKRSKINEHDYIVTAYAESASGPGWGNSPLWIIVRDNTTGVLRQECLQPSEQTRDIQTLYLTSQAAHLAMRQAVLSTRVHSRDKV